jgi:hypothetical protein
MNFRLPMNLRLHSLVPVLVSSLFGIMLLSSGGLTSVAEAMDWETAVEVASCQKRANFEKDGDRAVAILQKRNILAQLIYFRRTRDTNEITPDSKDSTKWGIFVNTRDAAEARQVLASEIAKGLRITLVP